MRWVRPAIAVGAAAGLGWLAWWLLRRTAVVGKAAPEAIRAVLDELFPANGVPRWFAYTQAELETGFGSNVDQISSREESYGLMGINWNAHAVVLEPRGITREMLHDPRVNAEYFREVAGKLRRAAAAKGYAGEELWEAVRLRLAGIVWTDFQPTGSGVAWREGGHDWARTDVPRRMARYRRAAARWQPRVG